MSDQEIKDAIIERLKEKDITFNPLNLSTMVIIGYMYDMATHGMIETPFVTGERDWIIINTCKEFGLKPSDEDIFNLVNRWEVAEEERSSTAFLIIGYRDDKNGFLHRFDMLKK